MANQQHIYSIPIKSRPTKSWFQVLYGTVSIVFFLTGCIMVNATQMLFVMPLRLIPDKRALELHETGVKYTKHAFGVLITLMCQLFGPTTLRITFESEGLGAFTKEDVERYVLRDANGEVSELRLPKKLVIIANHQIYGDWWYIWCLTYFMNIHREVLIVLKRSLMWVPILGWGMQVFRFIFLARSWASDKVYLVRRLAKLGRKAQLEDTPLAFMIYPEGTLVATDTRPISKKYADKLGIPDMTHILLPRSTGLHYSLRALAPRVPGLKLLDITVAYPGIPPMGFGQSYYTLRSIFMDGVPPPVVHMHLRLIDVASAVPIGDLSGANPAVTPPTASASSPQPSFSSYPNTNGNSVPGGTAVEADPPEKEREVFDEWLRSLWRMKDEKIDAFHRSGPGPFNANGYSERDEDKKFESVLPVVKIPIKLRSPLESLDAFCFFGPALFGYYWKKLSG